MIWTWAEHILRVEDGSSEYLNLEGIEDVNQNNLMDIYFGLDSYWKMDGLLNIAKLLK